MSAPFCILLGILRKTVFGDCMYYTFDDEQRTAELGETEDCRLTYGYISKTELQAAVRHFSLPAQSLVMLASPSHLNEVFVYENCVFTALCNKRDSLAFYVRKNLLLVVAVNDETHIVRDSFISLAEVEDPGLARLVCGLLDDLISGDSKYLLSVRETVEKMEKQLLSSNEANDFNLCLFNQKEALSELYAYCDNLLDFVSALKENKCDIFDEAELAAFEPVCEKISRLKERVRMIGENIEHLRDAYQSNLDLRLNQTMKIFTVFTVLFSPLSFIVGWYGMNFEHMPELSSPYGYGGVIVLVVAVATGLLLWFKHKKWI